MGVLLQYLHDPARHGSAPTMEHPLAPYDGGFGHGLFERFCRRVITDPQSKHHPRLA